MVQMVHNILSPFFHPLQTPLYHPVKQYAINHLYSSKVWYTKEPFFSAYVQFIFNSPK